MKVKNLTQDQDTKVGKANRGKMYWPIVDVAAILVMTLLLYYGASRSNFAPTADAGRYQCYAVAFWNGIPALKAQSLPQCGFLLDAGSRNNLILWKQETILHLLERNHFPNFIVEFVKAQSINQPLRVLPYEYPLLTILPISIGLLAPTSKFQFVFAIGMLILAAVIYGMLLRWRSRSAALAYAALITVSVLATLAGRFDIVPSVLTLAAVICGMGQRWRWSFAFLALATLLKFYPAILVPVFLIAQQLTVRQERWISWRRWAPLGVFVLVSTVVMLVSLALNVEGTLAPFGYFGFRPVQVESLAASILWLTSVVGIGTPKYVYTFGSLNILHPASALTSYAMNALLLVGLLYIYWLQWRAKIDLAMATLLTLLIVIVTGKVFSPQYLMWVVPLVAYVGVTLGAARPWWFASWFLLGMLTTWIYPYLYNSVNSIEKVPLIKSFMPIVTLRNLLLFAIVVVTVYLCTRRKSFSLDHPFPHNKKQA